MTTAPSSVSVAQSPWRQMPGKSLEVARAVALAVGVVPEADGHRGQRRGEHELADLVAQRPRRPRRGRRSAAPRQRHWISPARTGSSGQPLTKAEQTSVPPLVETGHTCSPTASRIQWKVSGGSGEPVEAIARRAREVVAARRGRGRPSRRRSGSRRSCRAPWRRRAPPPRTGRRARDGAGCRRRARSSSPRAGRRRASSRPSSPCPCRRRSGRRGRGRGAARGGGCGRAAGRRGRGRSPWAARSCPTRRARRAGGRRGGARRRAAPATPPGPPTARSPAARRGRAGRR